MRDIREIEEEELGISLGENESNETVEEEELPELPIFPLPPSQLKIESLLSEMMLEKCLFIESLIREYNPSPLHCPFCKQLVDYKTMKCTKNHEVELCMKTFRPIIDPRKLFKCHSCNVSALEYNESDAYKWIYHENKCVIAGHKMHKLKY